MASINCNPEIDFCGHPDVIGGNYFQRMDPETAKNWFGIVALSNLAFTDILAYHTYNQQAFWKNRTTRRGKNIATAIWAWNIMFVWHTFVFSGIV
jgi:hypothetical protein